MTTYAWPDFLRYQVDRFEMRVQPNTRVFVSPFTGSAQVADYTGERWMASLDIVAGIDGSGGDGVIAAAIEAFFGRLRGPLNQILLWNLRRPLPLGSIRDGGGNAQWKTGGGANVQWKTGGAVNATWFGGGPSTYATMLQGSNILPVARTPGTTILAGDMLGAGGQLFQSMDNYTVDASGQAAVEVWPRARADIAFRSAITCTKPTAKFMLKSDGVPITHRPGMYDSTSLDLIEAI